VTNIVVTHQGLLKREVVATWLQPPRESDFSRTMNLIFVHGHELHDPFAILEAGNHPFGRSHGGES
jgi:hypothetical protein